MICPICGKEADEELVLNDVPLCWDCYSFFTGIGIEGRTREDMIETLKDYSRALSNMPPSELKTTLVNVFNDYSGRYNINVKVKEKTEEELMDAAIISYCNILMTTTDTIPSKNIERVYGLVAAADVGLFKTKGGITGLVMLNSITAMQPTYGVLKKIAKKASSVGANAIIGIKFYNTVTAEGGHTTLVTGTAVKYVD